MLFEFIKRLYEVTSSWLNGSEHFKFESPSFGRGSGSGDRKMPRSGMLSLLQRGCSKMFSEHSSLKMLKMLKSENGIMERFGNLISFA